MSLIDAETEKAISSVIRAGLNKALENNIIIAKKDFKRLQMQALFKGINIAEYYAGTPEANEWHSKEIAAFESRVDKLLEQPLQGGDSE